jgi:hypothetical protein
MNHDLKIFNLIPRQKNRWILPLMSGLLTLLAASVGAITTKVVITQGGEPQFRALVSQRLTQVANSVEAREWEKVSECCTNGGLEALKDLVETTQWRLAYPLYDEKTLLQLPGGHWEVRDLKVKVKMRDTRGDDSQYLVFTLTGEGLVNEARFAMENNRWAEIMEQGQRANDLVYRQPIISFLETFRTAYNRKDLEYLERVYSDDALIIVGRVLKTKPDGLFKDISKTTTLSGDKIEFIKLRKPDYMKRLASVFAGNAFVKVNFDSIDIKRSNTNPDIYGVMLKQDWRSSTYSDTGYLFLMLDFQDIGNPLIHVRSWQPERFSDGSVVNLGDFIITSRSRK